MTAPGCHGDATKRKGPRADFAPSAGPPTHIPAASRKLSSHEDNASGPVIFRGRRKSPAGEGGASVWVVGGRDHHSTSLRHRAARCSGVDYPGQRDSTAAPMITATTTVAMSTEGQADRAAIGWQSRPNPCSINMRPRCGEESDGRHLQHMQVLALWRWQSRAAHERRVSLAVAGVGGRTGRRRYSVPEDERDRLVRPMGFLRQGQLRTCQGGDQEALDATPPRAFLRLDLGYPSATSR
jgi:hypothetical protein